MLCARIVGASLPVLNGPFARAHAGGEISLGQTRPSTMPEQQAHKRLRFSFLRLAADHRSSRPGAVYKRLPHRAQAEETRVPEDRRRQPTQTARGQCSRYVNLACGTRSRAGGEFTEG